MKTKRLFSFIIALLMTASLVILSACEPENPDDGKNGDDTPIQTTEPTAPIDLTEAGKYMDFEGANGNMDLRLQAYKTQGSEIVFLSHDPYKAREAVEFDALRDVYGVTVVNNTVAPGDRITKFTAMCMNNEAPEIFIYEFMPSLVNRGFLEPIDNHIDFNLGLWSEIRSSVEQLKFKEHIYTTSYNQGRSDGIYFNKALFEEYGLKNPYEYLQEGNWNWDTLRELAIQLTIDDDADGTPEMWGFAMQSGLLFMYSAGMDFVTLQSDGTVKNNLKEPNLARAIQFYTDLCMKDCVVYEANDGANMFGEGKVAILATGAWERVKFPELLKTGNIMFIPFPKDPQSEKYNIYEYFGSYSIGKSAKNIEGAAAFIVSQRYMFLRNNAEELAERNSRTIDEQIEKSGWTNDLEDFYYNEFFKTDYNPVLTVWVTFGLGDYFGDFWFRPKMGETWSSIAEELYPKVDEKIAQALES